MKDWQDPSGPISYVPDEDFKKIMVAEIYALRKDLADLLTVTRKLLKFLEHQAKKEAT